MAKVKASKFKDWPNYGRAKKGVIGLQGDHEGTLEDVFLQLTEEEAAETAAGPA